MKYLLNTFRTLKFLQILIAMAIPVLMTIAKQLHLLEFIFLIALTHLIVALILTLLNTRLPNANHPFRAILLSVESLLAIGMAMLYIRIPEAVFSFVFLAGCLITLMVQFAWVWVLIRDTAAMKNQWDQRELVDIF